MIVRVSPRQCNTGDTVPGYMSKPSGIPTRSKNKNNLECDRSRVSEIKLKRTDTTLDLSQKAKRAKEKKKVVWKGSEREYILAGGGSAAGRLLSHR